MIVAAVWTALTALALGVNLFGLWLARGDLGYLLKMRGNGRRSRRLIVARAHVREEALMVWVQLSFFVAGVYRLALGAPPNQRVDMYRTVTTVLFLSAQVALVWNSVEKRHYRRQVLRAKERMLAEQAAADTRP